MFFTAISINQPIAMQDRTEMLNKVSFKQKFIIYFL